MYVMLNFLGWIRFDKGRALCMLVVTKKILPAMKAMSRVQLRCSMRLHPCCLADVEAVGA